MRTVLVCLARLVAWFVIGSLLMYVWWCLDTVSGNRPIDGGKLRNRRRAPQPKGGQAPRPRRRAGGLIEGWIGEEGTPRPRTVDKHLP